MEFIAHNGIFGKPVLKKGTTQTFTAVVDGEKLREEKIEEKFVYLLGKYNFDTVAPDQDYLNFLCKGSLEYIHIGWDKMPIPDANFDDKDLHLIHYNMFQKPWKYDNVMYEDYFWKYAKKTEYYEDLLKIRMEYSDEQKKKDAIAAEEMVRHALKIVDDRKSFSLCSVACNIAIIAFIIISIWFIVMAYFCGSHKDIDKQQTNIVKIKLNNSEPIKIQIID